MNKELNINTNFTELDESKLNEVNGGSWKTAIIKGVVKGIIRACKPIPAY
ncbi:ComC/BlpC family leader-containing pheromone/bacteriocin [Clostridium butyricum]